jgi:hypothetical protein
MHIPIDCPNCGKKLKVLQALLGKHIRCPSCTTKFSVAAPIPEQDAARSAVTSQPTERPRPATLNRRRRQRDDEYAEKPYRTREKNNLVSSVIPYKNGQALGAYYCGVFSLIPGAGLLLGPIALILGILGFGHVRAHPQAKGTGHAVAGIVMGSLAMLGNLLLVVVAALMATGFDVPLPNLSPNSRGAAPTVADGASQQPPAPDHLFEGPKTYLSDLQEIKLWPKDLSLGKNGDVGNPSHDRIVVNGQLCPKGLGMLHRQGGFCGAEYRLDGRYCGFRTMVAINESFEDGGPLLYFTVSGDDKLLWKSKTIRNKGETDECRIDVTGVKVLFIRTQEGGKMRDLHALWVEPCIYSGK